MRFADKTELRDSLAEAIVTHCFHQNTELPIRYGPKGREKCLQDTRFHLQYLFESISAGSPSLFLDYIGWAKVMLKGVNVPEKDLAANLQAMQESISQAPDFHEKQVACDLLAKSIRALPSMPDEIPSFIRPDNPCGHIASRYLELLLSGNRREASRVILEAAEQVSIKDIYLRIFQPVQHEIGRLWQSNQLSVAQEHFCTAATQLIMSQLYPRIFAGERNGYRMVATCIGSELHEIGIRMVADFFEMEGWDTYYLGANTPANSIVRTLAEKQAHLLALSATMTFHIDSIHSVIRAVRSDSRMQHVRIMVGGYPFNVDLDLWKKVGADGCGTNAQESESVARELLR
jgi:methanogenic corrinoid protein MtbC1